MSSETSHLEIFNELKQGRIPSHVAIVMDGNGRWAKQRGKPRVFGHQAGVESVHEAVKFARELGVKVLTLFSFSEENWGRPKAEVSALMKLLEAYVIKERKALNDANISFRVCGNLERLPERTKRLVLETIEDLSANDGMVLNIALSYGARSEITFACKQIAKKVAEGSLDPEDIKPELISEHLWTSGLPDPDLLIRTSGELRISNFLLWQIAYSELWFTKIFWPEFRREHFCEAIQAFQSRERRFGLVSES